MLFFITALLTVAHCRVTFTHSEVVQQSDLDAANSANFKCDNGCYIYSDSQSKDMFISDGSTDVSNFLIMGQPDKPVPTELVPSKNYKLVYRGTGKPPRFIFYAVDKKSPNLDSIVYAVNDEHGYSASIASGPRRFTVLASDDAATMITFNGDFPAGFPRIYATGYDATDEDSCSPVYQARSQESATNSFISVPSPILTVDKGASNVKATIQKRSGAFTNKIANSSLIYKSPGYVGCTYTNQIYYVEPSEYSNTLLDTFSAEVNSLDLDASVSISNANDAVHIVVNKDKVDLIGSSPVRRHFEADRFDVTISWYRNSPDSNFAVQMDLGIPQDFVETTTKSADPNEFTTSSGTSLALNLSPLIYVVCNYL